MPAAAQHGSDGAVDPLGKQDHHVPRRAAGVAMWLFLVSLTVLFVASLLGYLLIYFNLRGPHEVLRDGRLVEVVREIPPIELPKLLWLSTAVMIGASVTAHRALVAVARERQREFRRWLALTLFLAAAFIVVQAPSLYVLIGEHLRSRPPGRPTSDDPAFALIGLIVALIVIHALHVIGGVIPLLVTLTRARRGHYDHESHGAVRHLAMYWHFLDVVWLTMFALLLLTTRGA